MTGLLRYLDYLQVLKFYLSNFQILASKFKSYRRIRRVTNCHRKKVTFNTFATEQKCQEGCSTIGMSGRTIPTFQESNANYIFKSDGQYPTVAR